MAKKNRKTSERLPKPAKRRSAPINQRQLMPRGKYLTEEYPPSIMDLLGQLIGQHDELHVHTLVARNRDVSTLPQDIREIWDTVWTGLLKTYNDVGEQQAWTAYRAVRMNYAKSKYRDAFPFLAGPRPRTVSRRVADVSVDMNAVDLMNVDLYSSESMEFNDDDYVDLFDGMDVSLQQNANLLSANPDAADPGLIDPIVFDPPAAVGHADDQNDLPAHAVDSDNAAPQAVAVPAVDHQPQVVMPNAVLVQPRADTSSDESFRRTLEATFMKIATHGNFEEELCLFRRNVVHILQQSYSAI
ncbi:hypothetical protein QR680_000280 [Steinernema hermaphroditum]|uniref:Uncharacterized protein n=1 Tax=Steinernema hermaphroditum TaxID=289476 RepID=A0AA39GVM7_9BILA|nr:hypothetical protein QR680_000280 [Steinernema hermaphroditum]